jgi:hypothetical protein
VVNVGRVVYVDVTVVREPVVVDLWCRSCSLPSGVAFTCLLSLASDPTVPMGRMTLRRCVDCGGDEIED